MLAESFQAHQDVLQIRQDCFHEGKSMTPAIIQGLREISDPDLIDEKRLEITSVLRTLLASL